MTVWACRPVRTATCVAQLCWVMSHSEDTLARGGMGCSQSQVTQVLRRLTPAP